MEFSCTAPATADAPVIMTMCLWKKLTAALLAAVQLWAGVMLSVGGVPAKTEAVIATGAVPAPCDMSCCEVQRCWCEAAPVQAPAKPAPAVPLVQPLEFKLSVPLPAEDLLTLTLNLLEQERKVTAPPTEVIIHAPEAPLFALHCSWLI